PTNSGTINLSDAFGLLTDTRLRSSLFDASGNPLIAPSVDVYQVQSGIAVKIGSTTSSVPLIASVTPNSGQQGQTLASLVIVGQDTNFVQGTTVASFGSGITVNSLTVTSATSATANITIGNGTTVGARTVILTTGTETASLTNGFTVTA